MLAHGIIRYSTSASSSPILLVKNPNGSWCFCVDYRALNEDKFLIPRLDELFVELKGVKFFTNWIYILDIIKSVCFLGMLRKQRFRHIMVTLSSWLCRLALLMLPLLSELS